MQYFEFPTETPQWFVDEFEDGGTDPGVDPRDYTLVLSSLEQGENASPAGWNLLTRPDDEGAWNMIREDIFAPDTPIGTILTEAGSEAYYGIDAMYTYPNGEENTAIAVPIIYLYNATNFAELYPNQGTPGTF